jgi:hypothetical protein
MLFSGLRARLSLGSSLAAAALALGVFLNAPTTPALAASPVDLSVTAAWSNPSPAPFSRDTLTVNTGHVGAANSSFVVSIDIPDDLTITWAYSPSGVPCNITHMPPSVPFGSPYNEVSCTSFVNNFNIVYVEVAVPAGGNASGTGSHVWSAGVRIEPGSVDYYDSNHANDLVYARFTVQRACQLRGTC